MYLYRFFAKELHKQEKIVEKKYGDNFFLDFNFKFQILKKIQEKGQFKKKKKTFRTIGTTTFLRFKKKKKIYKKFFLFHIGRSNEERKNMKKKNSQIENQIDFTTYRYQLGKCFSLFFSLSN